MRKIRQSLVAAALTLTLSLSVFAGEISIPGATTPPPPPATKTTTATAAYDLECDSTTSGDAAETSDIITTDSFTEITLSLFQSVMSLF